MPGKLPGTARHLPGTFAPLPGTFRQLKQQVRRYFALFARHCPSKPFHQYL